MLLTITSYLLPLLSDWSIDACALVLSFYALLKLKEVMIREHQLAVIFYRCFELVHTLSATTLYR